MPGLTHEDRDQLHQKTLQLIDELQPSNLKSGGCELKTPRKASNEANLVSTQSTNTQWVESEKADPEGRERSQSAAAGQVDCDAGRQDSHRPMEGSTNDAMGISPHEGTDAAVEACPGDGPEQSLDRIEKSRQKASNEANLESTQSTYSQEVGSKKTRPTPANEANRRRLKSNGANQVSRVSESAARSDPGAATRWARLSRRARADRASAHRPRAWSDRCDQDTRRSARHICGSCSAGREGRPWSWSSRWKGAR